MKADSENKVGPHHLVTKPEPRLFSGGDGDPRGDGNGAEAEGDDRERVGELARHGACARAVPQAGVGVAGRGGVLRPRHPGAERALDLDAGSCEVAGEG